MYPLLFSCKQCAETFVSSKNLRSHGCNGMSNNERTSKGGKREEVLGEVVEIEGESNKHFETKDSSMFNNIQDVEKITKQLVGAENRTDLVNQNDVKLKMGISKKSLNEEIKSEGNKSLNHNILSEATTNVFNQQYNFVATNE